MAISLKHLFQSAKTDGPDNTIVQPSDWNDEHVLTQATNRLLGRTTAGTGATEEIAPGTGITLSAGTLSADVTSVAGRTGAVTLSTADISGLTTGYVQKTSATGSAYLPAGTTGQREGSPAAGYIRYNTTTGKFEGYGSSWGNIGGGAAIGDTPPANPGAGDLWWESDLGRMFVYYNDGDSSQWVDISAGGAGQYLPLTGGDVTGQITTTGNIGVGYATPAYRLHVVGSPANGILQYNANSAVGSTKSRIGFQDASTTYAPDLGSVGNNITFETVGAERMRIDASGRVTMPFQPCFYVTGPYSGGTNPISASAGSGLVVLWQTIITNVGSHYATSTGRFTAPIAGRYRFDVSVSSYGAYSGPYLAVRLNGSQVSGAAAIAYTSIGYCRAAASVILNLSAGDYVDAYFGAFNVSAAIDLGYSSFSGQLIS